MKAFNSAWDLENLIQDQIQTLDGIQNEAIEVTINEFNIKRNRPVSFDEIIFLVKIILVHILFQMVYSFQILKFNWKSWISDLSLDPVIFFSKVSIVILNKFPVSIKTTHSF